MILLYDEILLVINVSTEELNTALMNNNKRTSAKNNGDLLYLLI